MIYDWENDRDGAIAAGIVVEENILFQSEKLTIRFDEERGDLEDCTFKNFPTLEIDGIEICRCAFENCGELDLQNGSVENCRFEKCREVNFGGCSLTGTILRECDKISANDSDVERCEFYAISSIEVLNAGFDECSFSHCTSDGVFLYTDHYIDHCTFEQITARGEDGYIIDSTFRKKGDVKEIMNCRFVGCQVENEDGVLTRCEYFKAFSSYKTVSTDNIDYDTCVFEHP